jgi:uncharacterized membrane protein
VDYALHNVVGNIGVLLVSIVGLVRVWLERRAVRRQLPTMKG